MRGACAGRCPPRACRHRRCGRRPSCGEKVVVAVEGGGEEGRQQRRSDLSGLPEERCREVDHAAAAGARVGQG